MRRPPLLVAAGVLSAAVWLSAQEPTPGGQVFRGGVNVIRIDVSVLDKSRRPVRGLKASDFQIRENGQPQRIVAVAEVDGATSDPTPSAWMRYAPRDVVNNNLADQVGDGQAFAIVLDDFAIPQESTDMAVSVREIGRYIVDSLGPSDVAAVVYPLKPGRTEDFTHDRSKLLAAIDKFEAEQPMYRVLQPQYSGGIVGDMQRYSTALGRDPCFQIEPVIPTLRAVAAKLATVPQRRKALFFVSIGLNFVVQPGGSRCHQMLYDELRRTLELAQRYNVNIHGIDPAGAAGYRRYIEDTHIDIRNVRLTGGKGPMAAADEARVRHDFLEVLGEDTGGRPIVDTDDLEGAIGEVFQEYSSYYLLGYETTNGKPDGKYRNIDVTVNGRKDVEIHSRKGRWAENGDRAVVDEGLHGRACVLDCYYAPPRGSDFQLSGLSPYQPLMLRAAAYPIGRNAANRNVDVAAVLTVRLPAVLRAADETLTLIRTVYTEERAGAPVKETYERRVEPTGGDEMRYDILSRFSLPAGHHEIRFNGTSKLADASGSVIVEVVIPDSGTAATASSIVLGTAPTEQRSDPLAALLPIIPTTARDFSQGDRIVAYLKLYAPATSPHAPVEVTPHLLRADSTEAATIPPVTIPASAFDADGSADYQLELPMSSLKSGLHLLSLNAVFGDARTIRRDLVFRIR